MRQERVIRGVKEAAGKILARRTEIACEAAISGLYFKSPITIQKVVSVYVAGIWGEGHVGSSIERNPGSKAIRVSVWIKMLELV